jgi:leucyl/phenylalanyl-tRNA--protein transferase
MSRAPRDHVMQALEAYAQGHFPMDSLDAQDEPLPFYTADPRCILDVTADGLDRLRRKVRRSLAAADPGWTPRVDGAFEATLEGCMATRADGDGVWLTPRLAELYRGMHAAGFAHSFELWDGDVLLAGVLGVVLARAAMLESMFHTVSHAGNVNLVRTLERLVAQGVELCDIQLPTEHTRRLGARAISARDYDRRLRSALI